MNMIDNIVMIRCVFEKGNKVLIMIFIKRVIVRLNSKFQFSFDHNYFTLLKIWYHRITHNILPLFHQKLLSWETK